MDSYYLCAFILDIVLEYTIIRSNRKSGDHDEAGVNTDGDLVSGSSGVTKLNSGSAVVSRISQRDTGSLK